jgi:hypothetical protein
LFASIKVEKVAESGTHRSRIAISVSQLGRLEVPGGDFN